MTTRQVKNRAASVHQRLLNLSRTRGEALEYVLVRYALERLLYRLGRSAYADRFVLKGALLFSIWAGAPRRPTRDADLLGLREADIATLERIMREVCAVPVDDDGLHFVSDAVRGEEIRDDQPYGGVRIRLQALLGSARIPVQVDVGFGDAVTPSPLTISYPTLLDFPPPTILGYPRETVVAEKFEAIVRLELTNSRMKDFYDVLGLARAFEFDGPLLSQAIGATFKRRGTGIPRETPLALRKELAIEPARQTAWRGFLGKSKLEAPDFGAVVDAVRDFLLPPSTAAAQDLSFQQRWPAGGPWR